MSLRNLPRTLCLAASVAIFAAMSGSIAAQNWELVWSDEFDGPSIDSSKWSHEVNAQGGGNNELQFYTSRSENSFVQDGKLVIRAIKEQYTAVDPSDGQTKTRSYTSARLNTNNKGDWLYGRYEVRAKLPGRQGLWPAIWMLPTDWVYGGWAASGEIDIMEHRGDRPTILYTTIHYGGGWPNNVHHGAETTVPDLSEDFHVYAFEWYENEMIWFFDGTEVWRTDSWYSDNGDYPAPFDQRFHMMLNVAVGGSFLPDPPADADYFPREMQVDYVRVYQRNNDDQQPWSGTPVALPARIEAEHYDTGGSMVAYSDNDASNNGGAFRLDEGVDIENSQDEDGTYSIGWFSPGEWVEYTVNVPRTGEYGIAIRNSTQNTDAAVRVDFRQAGATVTSAETALSSTGGWYNWTTTDVGSVNLTAGDYIIRVNSTSADFNFNYLEIDLLHAATGDMWIILGE
ncbi:family 16 glycosylhydrolase [bacterium]|nr:family 16 glycosylhydrolase [bacterium]